MTSNEEHFETHKDDRGNTPAGLNACRECPFRTENLDRPHPNPIMYARSELTRLWHGVSREGNPSNCHMFDGDMHPWNPSYAEQGYKKPANTGNNRECAGLLAMVKRELERYMTCESYADYANKHPQGLSEVSLRKVLERISNPDRPSIRFSDFLQSTDVVEPEQFVIEESAAWQLTNEQAATLAYDMQALFPSVRACNCAVCSGHTAVHQSRELHTAEGQTVAVDSDLWPLLNSMAKAGLRTTDSCVNLREVIETVDPHSLTTVINGTERGVLSYERVVREQLAFIRLRNDSTVEQRFISSVTNLAGVEVQTTGSITQLAFTSAHIDALFGAIGK